MSEPHPYRLPVLRKSSDLSKPWYVEYYVWDERNEKLKRRRAVLLHKSEKLRESYAKDVIKEISAALESGAIFNPKPKIINTAPNAITGSTTIIKAIEYFEVFHAKTLTKNTRDTYHTDLKRFIRFLKRSNLLELPLGQFTDVLAMQFTDELTIVDKLGNRTRNNTKATITTFFNFQKKRKILKENPFENIEKLRTLTLKHTAISNEHAKLIIAECKATNQLQLLLFIHFIYYTAIRPGTELRLLKISDIFEKTICISAEHAKDDEKEHVRIPPPLERIITEHNLRDYPKNYYVFSQNQKPGEKPNGKKFQYKRHVEILQKLDLMKQKYDIYAWKHTGMIALFIATQDLELIRQQCRHSSIATTTKYLRDLGQFVDFEKLNSFPEI